MSTAQTLDTLDMAIKFIARSGKIILGTKKTLKLIKLGKIRYVVIASNIPEEIKQDVEYYARLSGVKILRFPGSNKDLGMVIGKPFGVVIMGIMDTGQISSDTLDKFAEIGG